MRFLHLAVVSLATLTGASSLRAAQPDGGRVCYSPAETRAAIAKNSLSDPMVALRKAARSINAEPLVNRLCKWNNAWVYEMTLLPKNGKVTRIFVNALDGSPMGPRD